MTFYQSEIVLNRKPAKLEAGVCTVHQRAVFTLPIGRLVNSLGTVTNAFAVGNIIEALVLPADHVIVDARIDCDKLDAATSSPAPALAFDVGIMPGVVGQRDTSRTPGAQLFKDANTAQGGGVGVPSLRSAHSILPASVDRSIGLRVSAAAATALTLTAASKFTRNVGFWQPGTVYAVGDFFFLSDGRRVFVDTGGGGTSGTNSPLAALGALSFANGSNTAQEGSGVTWTMGDPYIALTIGYRSFS